MVAIEKFIFRSQSVTEKRPEESCNTHSSRAISIPNHLVINCNIVSTTGSLYLSLQIHAAYIDMLRAILIPGKPLL